MAESAADLVRRWYRDRQADALRRDATIDIGGIETSMITLGISTMRYLNGLGPDSSAPEGEFVYAFITEALKGAQTGSEADRHASARAMGMR